MNINPIDDLLNKIKLLDSAYGRQSETPAQLAKQFIRVCNGPDAKQKLTELRAILERLTECKGWGLGPYNVPAHLRVRCYAAYPGELTHLAQQGLASSVGEVVRASSESKSEKSIKQVRKVVAALEAKSLFSILPQQVRLQNMEENQQTGQLRLLSEESMHPLLLCGTSISQALGAENIRFFMQPDLFACCMRFLRTGTLFAQDDPRGQDLEFLTYYWKNVQHPGLSSIKEAVAAVLFTRVFQNNPQFAKDPDHTVRIGFYEWVNKTFNEACKITYDTLLDKTEFTLRGPLPQTLQWTQIHNFYFDSEAAFYDFLQKHEGKIFPEVECCSLPEFKRAIDLQDLRAFGNLFPKLQTVLAPNATVPLAVLPEFVNPTSIQTVIRDRSCIGEIPIDQLKPITLIFYEGASQNGVQVKTPIKESSNTLMLFQTHEFGKEAFDLSQCSDKSRITDSCLERATKIGLLTGKRSINLSGCSQITDSTLFVMANYLRDDLRSINLTGCRISNKAILALVDRCPNLQEIRVSESLIYYATHIAQIRAWMQRNMNFLYYSGPQPWWKYQSVQIQSIL